MGTKECPSSEKFVQYLIVMNFTALFEEKSKQKGLLSLLRAEQTTRLLNKHYENETNLIEESLS